MKKRNVLLFALASSAILLTSCGEAQPENKVDSVIVSCEGDVKTLEVGKTLQFSAAVLPESLEQKVTWSVNNITGEAAISTAGLLTASKEGKIEVVAASYLDENVKGTYLLDIVAKKDEVVKPTSIKLLAPKQEIEVNETAQLSFRVQPEGASEEVTFSSDHEDIVAVQQSGKIKGLKPGTANITVTSKLDNTIKNSLEIRVLEGQPEGPSVDWSKVQVSNHEQYLNAEVETALKVEGVCTFVEKGTNKDGTYNAVLSNGTGGYYVYGLNKETQVLQEGKKYTICGFKNVLHTKNHELYKVEQIEELTKNIEYTVTNAASLNLTTVEALKPYLNGYVSFDSLDTKELSVRDDGKAFNFIAYKNDQKYTFRIDPVTTGSDGFTAIVNKLKSIPYGSPIKIKKCMADQFGYGNPEPQFKILSADDFEVLPLTDKQIVELASTKIELPNSLKTGDDTKTILPKTIKGYDGLTIEYTFDGTDISNDGVVKCTSTKDVKFSATVKKGQESKKVDLTITIIGTEKLTTVHSFDLEDALPAGQYGCSESKPSYSGKPNDDVTLGTPHATWELKNTLIGQTESDVRNGNWSMRMQNNSTASKAGAITLKQGMNFSQFEFQVATYGNDELGSQIEVAYSNDDGNSWKGQKVYTINSRNLDTIRYVVKEPTENTRVSIKFKGTVGKRLNFDDLKLLK